LASPEALAASLAEIARKAGRVLAGFHPLRPQAMAKADQSPVTEADRASEALILAEVAARFPGLRVISEENAESHAASGGEEFLLVDPLDGTRAFIAGTADFCVSLALVRAGVPVLGHARGALSASRLLPPRPPRALGDGLVALASHFHGNAETDALLAQAGATRIIRMSSALKFVKLFTGEADFYPRRTPTMQWDIAAGDALMRAAGGGLLDDAGTLLAYGRTEAGWRAPPFLAYGTLPG
jgi:3'(2'), 5'-bisphosphate nucleotidase